MGVFGLYWKSNTFVIHLNTSTMRFLTPINRLRVLFTLILGLLGSLIVITADAQIDETPQAYGAEPLIEFSYQLMEPGDNVQLDFIPDADLLEVIFITWDEKGGHIDVISEFDSTRDYYVSLISSHDVYFRTVNGVTAVTYITSDDGTEISVILNGKLVTQYTDGEIDPTLGGRKPDHFKETIDWAYSAENFVMD